MKKSKMLKTSSVIAHGVQIHKFEVDWMSSFQDMTYYYLVIGICLIIVDSTNYFSDSQILIIILNSLLSLCR